MEAMESLNLYSVPVGGGKYVDYLRDRYTQELDYLSGFNPHSSVPKVTPPLTEEEAKKTQSNVLQIFAMKKRLTGGK